MNEPLVITYLFWAALKRAVIAHGDQKRKYTNDPYIVHPIEVADILEDHGQTDDVIAAGLLHDTVEDTSLTLEDIRKEFGLHVADLVSQVTDVAIYDPKNPTENRAARVAKNIAHAAQTTVDGAAIKLADLISNTKNISDHDPQFAKVYLGEKEQMLEVLRHGPPSLVRAAFTALLTAQEKIKEAV